MNTDNMVFVFGSNLAGIHGAGAAKYAAKYKGAKYGIGYGRYGGSFAIPTKGVVQCRDRLVVGDTLPLEQIREYVDRFIHYAEQNPQLNFQVTAIGCGLAALKHSDVAPMFKGAPDNCYFDNLWFPYLTTGGGDKPQHQYWGTF